MPAHIYKQMKPNNQAFIFRNILNHHTVTDIHTHNSSSNTSRYQRITNKYDIRGLINIVTINKNIHVAEKPIILSSGINNTIINNRY